MKVPFSIGFWLLFLLAAPFVFVATLVLAASPRAATRTAGSSTRSSRAVVFGFLRRQPALGRAGARAASGFRRGPAVIVCNHQSMADILAVLGLFHPFKFVSKASLFEVPLVGWTMSICQYVRLERGQVRSTQRMLEDCAAWLRRGMAVLIFPEGTYGARGERLPFKPGAFQLAIAEQVPIVPVRLTGTDALVVGDGPWMAPRATVRVEVLEPIDPRAFGTDAEALAARVRALYLSEAPPRAGGSGA